MRMRRMAHRRRPGAGHLLLAAVLEPDFVADNTSSDYDYVKGANAYTFVLTISGLVNYAQVNTIQMVNQGGWVQAATGDSPTTVPRDVIVTAS
jgi:hypothetical protein